MSSIIYNPSQEQILKTIDNPQYHFEVYENDTWIDCNLKRTRDELNVDPAVFVRSILTLFNPDVRLVYNSDTSVEETSDG